ncbi:MAG: 50S ribosomal protein L30 [Acidobacteria bacterium ACB2]|nr:50S ribosomal protein L30 [Acidobacteria bacterium ACB2]
MLVRQVKSGICTPEDHKRTLKGLGLSGPRSESTLVDSPSVRGQIRKVRHLVTVVE